MRDMAVRGLLIYCFDYKCSDLVTISNDRRLDEIRLAGVARATIVFDHL
jgi:hypothetical protein